MDLTSTLIGLGLVALTALPIIYFHIAQKNERKQFLNSFIALATQQHLKLTRHALWGHYNAVGLDEGTQKLLFLRKGEVREEKELINLAEVENCRVIVQRKPLNGDQIIEQLELVFTFHNSKAPDKKLLFYSKDEEMSLNGELQLVEQWQALISPLLATYKESAVLD